MTEQEIKACECRKMVIVIVKNICAIILFLLLNIEENV